MIFYRPDKYIETSEHGLVVMNVNEADAGRYDCKMGGDIVCSYNITVDAHRCSAPARTNDFQKVWMKSKVVQSWSPQGYRQEY